MPASSGDDSTLDRRRHPRPVRTSPVRRACSSQCRCILELLPSRAQGPLLQSASEPLTSEQVAGSAMGDIGAPEPAVPVETGPTKRSARVPPSSTVTGPADDATTAAPSKRKPDRLQTRPRTTVPAPPADKPTTKALRALALVPLARGRRCNVLLRQIPSKRESLLCGAGVTAAGRDPEVARVHARLVSLDRPGRHRTPVSRSR